jgi:Uma2 family endonuclease
MTLPTTRDKPQLPDERPLPTGPITYEQFLEWLDDETHAEWVNGEIVLMSPINRLHQRLLNFLISLFELFLDARPLGEFSTDPFQMKVSPDLPGRAPDLIFVANEHLDRLHDTWLEGPADLVIEIISPDSAVRDREEKFSEYEQGGVREYWLLDPQQRTAEFFQLGDEGRYQLVPLEEGIFHSRVLPGFWLKAEWLWEPRPRLLDVLQQWGLI